MASSKTPQAFPNSLVQLILNPYAAEAAPLQRDLDSLKKLREQVSVLADANTSLHARVTELNREIHAVERSLSRETRTALGVAE